MRTSTPCSRHTKRRRRFLACGSGVESDVRPIADRSTVPTLLHRSRSQAYDASPSRSPPRRLGQGLDHPALSVRLDAQDQLAASGTSSFKQLSDRLHVNEPITGRLHALWTLEPIGDGRVAGSGSISLARSRAQVRLQAARSCGIRIDHEALDPLIRLLSDRSPAVRCEAAIALGRIADPTAVPALFGRSRRCGSVRRVVHPAGDP